MTFLRANTASHLWCREKSDPTEIYSTFETSGYEVQIARPIDRHTLRRRQSRLTRQYASPGRASRTSYGKRCFPLRRVINQRHNHLDAASLGHPKAKRCYAWSHLDGKHDERTRFVAVLEIPPVNSPETAVRVQIVKDVKEKK